MTGIQITAFYYKIPYGDLDSARQYFQPILCLKQNMLKILSWTISSVILLLQIFKTTYLNILCIKIKLDLSSKNMERRYASGCVLSCIFVNSSYCCPALELFSRLPYKKLISMCSLVSIFCFLDSIYQTRQSRA